MSYSKRRPNRNRRRHDRPRRQLVVAPTGLGGSSSTAQLAQHGVGGLSEEHEEATAACSYGALQTIQIDYADSTLTPPTMVTLCFAKMACRLARLFRGREWVGLGPPEVSEASQAIVRAHAIQTRTSLWQALAKINMSSMQNQHVFHATSGHQHVLHCGRSCRHQHVFHAKSGINHDHTCIL